MRLWFREIRMLSSICRPHLCSIILGIVSLALGQDVIVDRPRLVPNRYGPGDAVQTAVFSKDSSRIFTAGRGKVVNSWAFRRAANGGVISTYTGPLRWTLSRGGRGFINTIAASSDGRSLAVAGEGALDPYTNIVVYDTGTREILRTLQGTSAGHRESIVHLDYAPNGQQLASTDLFGNVVVWDGSRNWEPRKVVTRAWTQQSTQQPNVFVANNILAVCEPTDQRAIGQVQARWQIDLYDVAGNPRKLGTLPSTFDGAITAIARGPQGLWASADEAGKLYVSRGSQLVTPRRLRNYKRSVSSLAFAPNGLLAVGNYALYRYKGNKPSAWLELWDPRAAKNLPFRQVEVGSGDIQFVAFSPDGRFLLSQDRAKNDLLLFPMLDSTGKPSPAPLTNPTRIFGRAQRVARVAFASTDDYHIGLSRGTNQDTELTFALAPEKPAALGLRAPAMFSGKWIDPRTREGGWELKPDAINRSVFSLIAPDGRTKTIKMNPYQGWYSSHCFLPDATGRPYAVAVGTEVLNGIFIYELGGGSTSPIRYYRDHSGTVTTLACSQDGRYLASGSGDQTVKIWSLAGLQNGSSISKAWGMEVGTVGGRMVVQGRPDKAGIGYARSFRSGDVIKSFLGYDDNGKVARAESGQQMFRLLQQLPIYRQKLLILERNGVVVPNPDDPTGQGRRLIIPGWEPLLTLFADRDDEWAIYTPQGYFDSSVAEGGDLFGWHINRRRRNVVQELTPRFLRGSNLQKEMERPEVIQNVLRVGNVPDALVAANEPVAAEMRSLLRQTVNRIPTVHIEQPLGTQTVQVGAATQLRASITYPAGSDPEEFTVRATATHKFLGVPVRQFNAANRTEVLTWNFSPDYPGEQLRVSVKEAGGGRNRLFDSDSVYVSAGGNRPVGTKRKYRLHLVTLSSEKYEARGLEELEFSHDDVESVIERLQRYEGLYELGDRFVLRDEEISKQALAKAREQLKASINQGSTDQKQLVLVYVAGHGLDVDSQYYYLPTSVNSTSDESIQRDGIEWSEISKFTDLGAQTMFMLDTCRAGNAVAQIGEKTANDVNEQLKSQLRPIKQNGAIVVAATSEGQDAFEDEQYGGGHGAFTASVLQGLDGAADLLKVETASRARSSLRATSRQDEIVTVGELIEFVVRNVFQQTGSLQKPCYTPKADEFADLYTREFVKTPK
ncbi:MAG: caspase family protein [Planctomycetaceae bacterium]